MQDSNYPPPSDCYRYTPAYASSTSSSNSAPMFYQATAAPGTVSGPAGPVPVTLTVPAMAPAATVTPPYSSMPQFAYQDPHMLSRMPPPAATPYYASPLVQRPMGAYQASPMATPSSAGYQPSYVPYRYPSPVSVGPGGSTTTPGQGQVSPRGLSYSQPVSPAPGTQSQNYYPSFLRRGRAGVAFPGVEGQPLPHIEALLPSHGHSHIQQAPRRIYFPDGRQMASPPVGSPLAGPEGKFVVSGSASGSPGNEDSRPDRVDMLAPQLAHRKRGQSEVFARTSSIAGTVYNSSAVYKRLKPSTCSTSTASELGNTGLRPQGRPFSSNITGRFLLHDDMISLLRYMNKKNTQRLACYDFRKADDDGTKNSSPGTGSVASTVGEDTVQSTRSSPGMCSGRTGSASSPRTHRKSAPCKFEDISLDVFVSDDPVLALDSFFSAKHCAIKLLDDSGPVKSPSQHTITHNPPVQTQSLMSTSSTGTSSPSPSSPGSVKIESPDVSGMQTPSTNPGKRSPHALNFILNNSVTTVSSPKKADDHQNEANVNFHKYIVDAFGIKEYQFIKAIRDSNGHILKLESIRPPRNSDHEIEYSAEWVKKAICYPRYKGGMKIHLVRDDQSFILYNDLKMMLWDIKQEDSIVKDAIPLQHIEVDPTVRDSLFGGRMVYVKIA